MSAIWGAIDFLGKEIDEDIKSVLKKAYGECVIDRIEELNDTGIYMGCGIQYFTSEAVREKLPVALGDKYFTADVILDNRQELYSKLWGEKRVLSEIPDGELLFKMYLQYGQNCLDNLLGAYAFVYYDRQRNRVDIIIDAVGDRCVYYAIKNHILYFSSLMEPLVKLTGAGLNDRWITDFLAMDHLFMSNEAEETPYEGIYRVAPAQRVTIQNGRVEKALYWDPFVDFQELKLEDDRAYADSFRKVFERAVRDAMRSMGKTSILLSGGLDSNAVAAVASNILKERGENLYSFTSVPLKNYKTKDNGYDLEDETQAVKRTAEFLGNIEPTFVELEGVDPWTGRKQELHIMEMPYKSVQNMLWIPECMRQAYCKGSRLMLSGSFGNTTISYTNLEVYMNDLYHQKKWRALKKELRTFAEVEGFPVRYAWKKIKSAQKESSYLKTDWESLYGKSFVRPAMIHETGADERMLSMNRKFAEASLSHDNARRLMIQDVALRQIGEAATKHSLATGVILRDPTKDKRVIEFCLRLPADQFCKEGAERRLVREYMKDIVPAHILEAKTKGKQSADMNFRLSLCWEKIRKEWIALYQTNLDSKYVDSALACKQLVGKNDIEQYTTKMLVRHIYTLMILELENKINKCRDEEIENQEKGENVFPLISIIIPVYNVAAYLKNCLESVLNQTYRNLEVILIDDGSTDGSGEICDNAALQDTRVRVLHQKNAGVSNARNRGLEYATGELVGFVDADDVIEPDMYEKMTILQRQYQAQIVCCAYKQVTQHGKTYDFADGEICVLHGTEMYETYLANKYGRAISPAVWNKLFTRDLIGSLRFDSVQKYEDQIFVFQILRKVKKAVYINCSFYHYYKRDTGLSLKHYGSDEVRDFVYAQTLLLRDIETDPKIRQQYYFARAGVFYCLLLDWYCGKKRRQLDKAGKKHLLQAINDIKHDAMVGIENKKDIPRRDKQLLRLSSYSVVAYRVAGKGLNWARKIKKCINYVRNRDKIK